MKYLLMNKNIPLVEFDTTEKFGITDIENENILSSVLPIGFKDMNSWIEQRNYAKHKEHLKKWLKAWGIDTVDGFLQITHCLGLNDSLWVKQKSSGLDWKDVNLYDNEFTDVACKTAFEKGLFGLQLSTTTPEFTTDGTFPKCWIKDGDGIHILKQGLSGASNVGLEPYCEYISSNIGAAVFDNIIRYDLVKYKNILCSKCDLFTTDTIGYVPFGKTVDTGSVYTIPRLLEYFKHYDEKNGKTLEDKFRKMILLDSIVFNMDRHLFNFGFLFDNETMEILDFAPVFDFNFSFLCSYTMDDLKNYRESLVKYDTGHKLGGNFDVVGCEILTPKLKDMLPRHMDIPFHKIYNMEQDRLYLLEDIFEENYRKIKQSP